MAKTCRDIGGFGPEIALTNRLLHAVEVWFVLGV